MNVINEKIEMVLRTVEKPSRYIGGEWNSLRKDPDETKFKFALCFPDLYEIGMSHLGYKILYNLLNSRDDVLAERFFMPWIDMQQEMRKRQIPLFSLENRIPLKRFDIAGFSLQYELNYTNILAMLDMGAIPLKTDARDDKDPLVVAGGPAAFNPEPLSRFIDLFLIGDGEESVLELVALCMKLRGEGARREEIIGSASCLAGVYAPSLYGTLDRKGFSIPYPNGSAPFPVRKRIVTDIDSHPFPESVIVPHCEIVHDRVSFEIMRGCLTGCRFCQAGYIYRPRRERNPHHVRDGVKRSILNTGYDEASLTSLNSGEYPGVAFLLSSLMKDFAEHFISLSLPSLKPSSLTEEIVREIKKVRKTGFTIAPEAATERLRAVINKNINEEHIMSAAETAFKAGWRLLKLYFIIGLPTETQDDIQGIVDLVRRISGRVRESAGRNGRINVSLSSFIPKPHTPFQWLPMENLKELERKQAFIKDRLSSNSIRIKWHHTKMSFIEAVLSRGDRRLSEVIERAYRHGSAFDGWTDRFDFAKWIEAFESIGLNPSEYAYRKIDLDDDLPWDIIDTGIKKSFLKDELHRALRGEGTAVCGLDHCYGCAAFAQECRKIMEISSDRGALKETENSEETTAAQNEGEYRYRVQYRKRGKMRFLSHLDLTRTIIRGMRRASIPLVHSKGFNPMPKISFGPALPLGVESNAEYLDFFSREHIDEETFPEKMNKLMSDGISFRKIKAIPRGTRSLSDSLNLALYSLQLEEMPDNDRIELMIKESKDMKMLKAGEAKNSLWSPGMAEAVKDVYLEEGRVIKILLYIAGSRKRKIGDVMKNLAGNENVNTSVMREEMFMELQDAIYSPFLLGSMGREHVKRDDG